MQANTLHEAALGFLLTHQGEHLHADRGQLVDRCAAYLQQQHETTLHRATLVALQAMGEVEARGNAAHVDISASTSFAVFLRDPATGISYAFTAADLLRLARSQADAFSHALH